MPDKEKVRLLWEQVRQEDDLRKAVNMVADLTEQAVNERMLETSTLRDMIRKLDDDVRADYKQVQRALYGNGDPSHSILARLERIEECQKKNADNSSKIMWIALTIVVGQVVLALLKLI